MTPKPGLNFRHDEAVIQRTVGMPEIARRLAMLALEEGGCGHKDVRCFTPEEYRDIRCGDRRC